MNVRRERATVGRAGEVSDKKHILIVDGDPDELRMHRYYLQDHYKLTAIRSGKTAMDFLSKHTPDLILLDYLIQEHNGAVVLREIQSRKETKDIPVFFLTRQTNEDTIRECLELRPAGYIVKPVAKAVLLARLKEALN